MTPWWTLYLFSHQPESSCFPLKATVRSEGASIIHLCGEVAAVVVWWCFSCSSHSLSEKTRPTVLQQRPPVLRWAVIRGEEEGNSAQREPFCYSNLRKIWISCFHSLRMRPLSSGHIVNLTETSSEREVGFNRSAVTHLYPGVMWVQVLFPVCFTAYLFFAAAAQSEPKSCAAVWPEHQPLRLWKVHVWNYLLISLHPNRLWPL